MATVWFQNNWGDEREIAQVKNFNDVFTVIRNFLADHNYKTYYVRSWEENGRIKIDVGSWSEFFYTDLKYDGENNE